MSIEIIGFEDQIYPKFQSTGFSARFAFPFAKEVCHGKGYDIGCNRLEWCYPGAIPIDPLLNRWDAMDLPPGQVDYIFSSHCLEHLDNPWRALEYWKETLKNEGVLFLYLPDFSQKYWRPWNNKKHKSIFTPEMFREYFQATDWSHYFVSNADLNNSFIAIGEK